MKRAERHHLKQNELATSVARARDTVERHRRTILLSVVGIALLAVALAGFLVWRGRGASLAAERLAEAMTILNATVTPPPPDAPATATPATPATPIPGVYYSEQAKREAALPKLVEAAEAAPASEPGLAGRYLLAATLAELNRPTEAETRYQEVIRQDPDGIYGEMATLGLATLRTTAGQYDEAINTWKALTTAAEGSVPVDSALMQLGRAFVLAGKTADATEAFTRLVDEFPDSAYATAARQELNLLKER
jgi:tetratricopeptide (TPR) repeat protein